MHGKKVCYEIESSCHYLDENKTNSRGGGRKIRKKKIRRKKKDLNKMAVPILQRLFSKTFLFYACELFLVLLHILRFFVWVLWMFAI